MFVECFVFKKNSFWHITYQNFLLSTYFLHWVLMWRCWIPLTIKMIRRMDIQISRLDSPWRIYLAERTIDDSFIAKCHSAFIIGTSYGPFRFLMAHLQYFYVISNSFYDIFMFYGRTSAYFYNWKILIGFHSCSEAPWNIVTMGCICIRSTLASRNIKNTFIKHLIQ